MSYHVPAKRAGQQHLSHTVPSCSATLPRGAVTSEPAHGRAMGTRPRRHLGRLRNEPGSGWGGHFCFCKAEDRGTGHYTPRPHTPTQGDICGVRPCWRVLKENSSLFLQTTSGNTLGNISASRRNLIMTISGLKQPGAAHPAGGSSSGPCPGHPRGCLQLRPMDSPPFLPRTKNPIP